MRAVGSLALGGTYAGGPKEYWGGAKAVCTYGGGTGGVRHCWAGGTTHCCCGGGGRGSLGAGPRVVANPGTARLDLLLLLVMLAASSLLVASPAAAVTAAAGTAAPSFAFAALGLVKGPCLVLVIE